MLHGDPLCHHQRSLPGKKFGKGEPSLQPAGISPEPRGGHPRKQTPPGSPAPPEGTEAPAEAALGAQRARCPAKPSFATLLFFLVFKQTQWAEAIPGAAVAPRRQDLERTKSQAQPRKNRGD